MTFKILECQGILLFLRLVKFINKLMDSRAPKWLRSRMHRSAHRLMCHGLGLSLLQGSTAPVNSRSVPSVSRSVGTTTRVADVKKTVAPAKSSLLINVHC